jgi:vancomycin resistance protein YoaR
MFMDLCLELLHRRREDAATGQLVKSMALTPAQRISADKARHSELFKAMTREFEGSKSVVGKYTTLVRGLVMRDIKLATLLKNLAAELEEKERDLFCFEVCSTNLDCVLSVGANC